jgi:hypothetical protein
LRDTGGLDEPLLWFGRKLCWRRSLKVVGGAHYETCEVLLTCQPILMALWPHGGIFPGFPIHYLIIAMGEDLPCYKPYYRLPFAAVEKLKSLWL